MLSARFEGSKAQKLLLNLIGEKATLQGEGGSTGGCVHVTYTAHKAKTDFYQPVPLWRAYYRNVHNYIYNIDINPFKGIHIAYSERRVGGDQVLLLRTALEWHQNHLRADLEIRRPIHNRVHSNRHGPQLTSSASTR